MQVWNVLHVARWKCMALLQNIGKNLPSAHHRTNLSGYRPIFATKDVSTIGRRLDKQQYLPHKSLQYGVLWPTSGWDQFVSLGTIATFNRFRVLASLLQRHRSMEANQTLRDVWPSAGLLHYIYIFGGSCPVTEFFQVQNSLWVQTLRSPIFAALLHGTRVVGVSQTFRRSAGDATYIGQGGHHGGH